MHHCHEHHSELLSIGMLANYESITLIITLFITGLVGSFTHCIGMCGPIAVSQMSIRLIGLPSKNISEKEKIKCAFTLPYYFGKALAYSTLGLLTYFLIKSLQDIPNLKYLAQGLIVVVAALFIQSGLSKSFLMLNSKSITGLFENFILKTTQKYKLSTYSYKGIILGFILGLIPCGLVYGSIVTATSYASNAIIVGCAMFAFGIATIPGLFIVSYFGSVILVKYKKAFNIIYALTMFLNGYLLIRYALNM